MENKKSEPAWAKEFRAKFLRRRGFRMRMNDAAEMLGTSKRTLTRWLAGEVYPPVNKAALIADLLGMSMDRLFRTAVMSEDDTHVSRCYTKWTKTPLGQTLIAHGVTPRKLALAGINPYAFFDRLEQSSSTEDDV